MKHLKLKLVAIVIFVVVLGFAVLVAKFGNLSVAASSNVSTAETQDAESVIIPALVKLAPDVKTLYAKTDNYLIDKELEAFLSEKIMENNIEIINFESTTHHFLKSGLGFVFEFNDSSIFAVQFDTSGSRRIELAELFIVGSDYLSVLHDICYEKLLSQGYGDDEVAAFLSYNEFLYTNFVLDNNDLILYLDSSFQDKLTVSIQELGDIWAGDEIFSVQNIKAPEYSEVDDNGNPLLPEDEPVFLPLAVEAYYDVPLPMELVPDLISQYTEREDGKKYIALTFDDGPSAVNTPRLLDILAENDAKATFFMLGQRVALMPDILRRVVSEGSEIGNHSYNHLELTRLSKDNLTEQIEKTNSEIYEITGEEIRLLRPPYGSRNQAVIEKAIENKMAIIVWDIDPQDWKKSGAEVIANHVIKNAKDGSIVLLHDIYKNSVDAAEKIIIELKAQGYEFLTVSDLVHMNCVMGYGSVYRNAKGAAAQ